MVDRVPGLIKFFAFGVEKRRKIISWKKIPRGSPPLLDTLLRIWFLTMPFFKTNRKSTSSLSLCHFTTKQGSEKRWDIPPIYFDVLLCSFNIVFEYMYLCHVSLLHVAKILEREVEVAGSNRREGEGRICTYEVYCCSVFFFD